MEDLKKYTETELLKKIKDVGKEHQKIKEELFQHYNDVEEIEKIINEKLENLDSLEKIYVAIIEEFESR
jgi:septal ring factor EnvC (AmiA/AmiB activator)